MKRGSITYSVEFLIKNLKLPEDFKFSGVFYDPKYNTIRIFGYSERFSKIPEGGESLIEMENL